MTIYFSNENAHFVRNFPAYKTSRSDIFRLQFSSMEIEPLQELFKMCFDKIKIVSYCVNN